ncbi:ECF transporter S component [Erysipelothrix urinaevulpis]|uniref:ECF transporter S component n=1 Tax=Erysipelothrix urinaevulpis TaxID=2683717 RepID=UPI001357C17B|nr:ECF transporter S component [Erysipelothrix urinaevulpis]
MKRRLQWELKDIIMVGLISVVFAVIYLGFVYFATFLKSILAPFGLAPFANEFVFGVWFMAATLAAYIMQKPGVAIISEMLAALIEVLMGNFYGPMVFVSGFIQGLGAELGFAAFSYKKFDMTSLTLASVLSSIFSFGWGFFRNSFSGISPLYILLMFTVRTISAIIFSAVIVKKLGDGLVKNGAVSSYPIAKEDHA